MKNYTIPELSSVDNNEITDFNYVDLYLPQLRLVQLEGFPIRITINKEKYIELSSIEEEIDISKYYNCLKEVMNFFYSDAYLYAYINNDKLTIYDIYTNGNYLSTRDMNYLEQNYHIPIVKPIIEGNFTFNFLVEILNKKINGEGLEANSFHLLPCMYLNDSRTATSKSPSISTKIIIGEKKTWNEWVPSTPAKTITPTIVKSDVEKEILKITTKDERRQIYNEVLKNVSNYVGTNKKSFTETQLKWWQKDGKKMAYYFGIHTLPKTRHLVYNYCKAFKNTTLASFKNTIPGKWSELLFDFFQDSYTEFNLNYSLESMENFAIIFKEELTVFDKFYVAENDAKDDWRYTKEIYNV